MTSQLPLVRIVDDDGDFRESQKQLLKALGWQVADWADAQTFLAEDDLSRPGCLVLDIRMPGMTGLELQKKFVEMGSTLPVIFLTGHGDVSTAVHTMKYGAVDFLEKKNDPMLLAAAVEKACSGSMQAAKEVEHANEYREQFEGLTAREKEVVVLAAKGLTNKDIGLKLGIGAETVKMHKANAYGKLNVQSTLEAYQWLEHHPDNVLEDKDQS